jgi:hypothetical protein
LAQVRHLNFYTSSRTHTDVPGGTKVEPTYLLRLPRDATWPLGDWGVLLYPAALVLFIVAMIAWSQVRIPPGPTIRPRILDE